MKIGLLLVHGIGAQAPGETTQKFIEGLSRAAKVNVRSDTVPVTLEVRDRTIVLYEVYWADLLSGHRVKGTANIHYLLPLAWYPWFNRSSPAFRAAYSKAHTLSWCAVLSLAGAGLPLAWEVLATGLVIWMQVAPVMRLGYAVGEGLLWTLSSKLPRFFPPTEARRTKYYEFRDRLKELSEQAPSWGKKRLERKEAATPLPGATDDLLANAGSRFLNWSTAIFQKAVRGFRTAADDFFDEYVGDIQNYLDSAGGAFGEGHGLSGVSDKIRRRFHTALRTACESDCDEIQILSHSLGTVIAYHGLTGFGLKDLDPTADPKAVVTPLARITHLFTIGSPLEKIRFIWPKLIFGSERYQLCWTAADRSNFYRAPVAAAATPGLSWDNFWNSLDPVSGELTHFDCWCEVGNHPVRGGAGVLRAHVVYERTSDFLSFATQSLLGEQCDSTYIAGFQDKVLAWAENISAPVILVLSIVGGAVFTYYVALAIAWLITYPFGNPEMVQNAMKWLLIFGSAAAVLWLPRKNAAVVHARHWSLARE